MFRILAPALCLVIGLNPTAPTGEFNSILKITDAAPEWKDLPGTDGKQHSLADLKEKLVVVVFTCNTCPYAVDYEDRINELAKKYADAKSPDQLAVVAINCNRVPGDRFPDMEERAKEKEFVFPYLYDESQQIAKAYGATRTPEFFLLNRERQVIYMGAMDDASDAAKVKVRYLADAIEAALAEKEIAKAETPPVGCAIRFVRSRKGR